MWERVRGGGKFGALASLVISKNWNEWDLYRFYNVRLNTVIDGVHYYWPDRLPPPPYPSHLQAFIFACVEVESTEQAGRSKMQQRQQQATKHPRSKFS